MSQSTPYVGDFYDALGVERTATQDEIKKAFRKLARSVHPDVAGDDPTAAARFDRIKKAYDVLGDPEARARYDRGPVRRPKGGGRWTEQGYRMPGGIFVRGRADTRKNPRRRSRRGDPENNVSLDDLVGGFGGGTGGSAKRKRGSSRGMGGSQGGFSVDDLADGLPGAGFAGGGSYAGPQGGSGLGGGPSNFGGSGAQGPMGGGGGGRPDNRGTWGQRGSDGMLQGEPGSDIEMTVDVPGRVAARGGTVTLEYPRLRVTEDGRSRARYDEIHDLRVPPGTRSGTVLRAHHMGNDGTDGTYGDLVCTLRVVGLDDVVPGPRPQAPPRSRSSSPGRASEPPPPPQSARSKRKEREASAAQADDELVISVVEAILGGRVAVDTPTGTVRVSIPPGSSGGTRLRLRGRGRAGEDHTVRLRIEVPRALDSESRSLIERFAELNPDGPRG